MKTLNEYIFEGEFFSNIGAGKEEVVKGRLYDWLWNARVITGSKDIDEMIKIDRDGNAYIQANRDNFLYYNLDTITFDDKPESFPDGKFPDFVKITNCPSISASRCGLISLENIPQIHGSLIVADNKLKSFDGCPLTTIEAGYGRAEASLCIDDNDFETLDGCPSCNWFVARRNPHLSTIGKMGKKKSLIYVEIVNCALKNIIGLPPMYKKAKSVLLHGNKNLDLFVGNGIGNLLGKTDNLDCLSIDADCLKGVKGDEWLKALGRDCFVRKLVVKNCDDNFVSSQEFLSLAQAMKGRYKNYPAIKINLEFDYGGNRCGDTKELSQMYSQIGNVKFHKTS